MYISIYIYVYIIIYIIRKVSKIMGVSQARCFGVQGHPQQVGTAQLGSERSHEGRRIVEGRQSETAKVESKGEHILL